MRNLKKFYPLSVSMFSNLKIVLTQLRGFTGLAKFAQKYCWEFPIMDYRYRLNRLRFVSTRFKSCGRSRDKTSFDFSDKFHAMQCCAMNAKSSIIPKLPMGMVI